MGLHLESMAAWADSILRTSGAVSVAWMRPDASIQQTTEHDAVVEPTCAFTARTGRKLAVTQDLKLSYFPWLAVETGGITIGNAPGFGGDAADKPPFATIERVAARVKLLPLLSKQF